MSQLRFEFTIISGRVATRAQRIACRVHPCKKAGAFGWQNYPFARFTTVMRQVMARSWRDNPAHIEVGPACPWDIPASLSYLQRRRDFQIFTH